MVSILFLPQYLKLYLRTSFFVWFYLRIFFSLFFLRTSFVLSKFPQSSLLLSACLITPSVSQNSLSFFLSKFPLTHLLSLRIPSQSHFLRIFSYPHHSEFLSEISVTFLVQNSPILPLLMLLNCGFGEDSWEFLGPQGDPTSPFWRSALGFLWKEWC